MNYKKLILPEINNKLLVSLTSLPKDNLCFTTNFAIRSTKQFKLIKNIIFFELFSNKRPKIAASLYNKQLILRVTTTKELESQVFLQKNPVPWKNYFESFNIVNKFSNLSLLKSNLSLNCKIRNRNYMSVLIKSAYLD